MLRETVNLILSHIHNGDRAVPRVLTALAVALVLITVAAPSSRAASVSLTLPTVEGSSGKEARVPIALEGADGVGALQLELTYDPSVLEAKSATQGSLGAGALVEFKVPAPGLMRIALVTGDAIKGTGPVVVASFDVVGKKGQKSPLTLGNVRAWQGDADRFDIKISSLGAGAVTVGGAGGSFPWWIVVAVALVVVAALVVRQRRRPRPAVATAPAPTSASVYVDARQPLVTTDGQEVGALEPGQWYRVTRQDGEWLEVTDASGVTGWVRADSVRR